MRVTPYLIAAVLASVLIASAAAAARAPLSITLSPDRSNPAAPAMGDHLQFSSSVTNTTATPIEGLVAWISLVEVDRGNEQPVDLEDWSAHKAVAGASLGPGQTLKTAWPMRLIKAGDYRVVVSVTDRGGRRVYTGPTVQFHVRQKPVLQSSRVLPVAAGVPLLFLGLMTFNKTRRHLKGKVHHAR